MKFKLTVIRHIELFSHNPLRDQAYSINKHSLAIILSVCQE